MLLKLSRFTTIEENMFTNILSHGYYSSKKLIKLIVVLHKK